MLQNTMQSIIGNRIYLKSNNQDMSTQNFKTRCLWKKFKAHQILYFQHWVFYKN